MVINRLLNSTKETGAQIGCGQTKVYEFIASGDMLAVQVGGQTKIPQSEIERFIRERPLIESQRSLGSTYEDALRRRDSTAGVRLATATQFTSGRE